MIGILLDTSAYSALIRGHAEVADLTRRVEAVCVTPVVVGELLSGFRRLRNRRRHEDYLRTFLASSRVAVMDVDAETSERYASILEGLRAAGTPLPTNDVWIAASAMQHGLAVATLDAHFERIPQILVRRFRAV